MKRESSKLKFFAVCIMLLAAVICIQPVSADSLENANVPIFTIPEKTIVYDGKAGPEDRAFSEELTGVEIPKYLTPVSSKNTMGKDSTGKSINYDLVKFDNVISIRSDSVSIPINIYGIEYIADLEKLSLGDENDGIDSYSGTLRGVADSKVIWTVDENNVVSGFVSYPGEYIVIKPVQESGKNVVSPFHVIYSEYDLEQPSSPIEFCGVDTETENQFTSLVQGHLNQNNARATDSGVVYVDVLVVVDEESYSSYWMALAQGYIAEANDANSFGRDDIQIQFNAYFDSSKKAELSAHPRLDDYPIVAVRECYPNSLLNTMGMDICVYLGGTDLEGVNDSTVGLGGGRHAWVQTAHHDPISQGEYFIKHTFIHELGHIFRATHEETYVWKTILGIDQATVMEASFHGIIVSKLEFSSTYYRGDSTHNNALHLRQNKASVSAYT